MHASELFGDAQLLANLDVWAANGFLEDLVHRGTDAGFEVWVTADHGNLEFTPAGRPTGGAAIEAAGKRLLRYPNRTLRDASAIDGIVWDEIPGIASGRRAPPVRPRPTRLHQSPGQRQSRRAQHRRGDRAPGEDRAVTPVGMIYDRALTPDLLDLALRVATTTAGAPDARRQLTVALRDHVSAQEAEGKTKKCLSRVWVSPPGPARAMIRWGVENQYLDPERTILHFAALLATFPFFGAMASITGRQLHLDGAVDPQRVRADARLSLGDRSSIDVGARKAVTTLRYLGLLEPEKSDGRVLRAVRQPAVPPELSPWMTHALLLTRQASAVGVDELSRAPELATVKVQNGRPNGYNLLEAHTEGSRTVAVAAVR